MAVLILDLSIVFPALILAATGLLRKKLWAGALSGIMLIKVFTVCISWCFGEVRMLTLGLSEDPHLAYISGGLTLISLILLVGYFRSFHLPNRFHDSERNAPVEVR